MNRIDLSYLEEITGGDNEMMLEMLDLFISDIPTHVQNIRTYASNGELVQMGKEAHKVKPTMQYIGLGDMLELVKTLEVYGKNEESDKDIDGLITQLEAKTEEILPMLEEKKTLFS